MNMHQNDMVLLLNLVNMSMVLYELLPLDNINFYVIVCIAVSSVNPAKLRNYCSFFA